MLQQTNTKKKTPKISYLPATYILSRKSQVMKTYNKCLNMVIRAVAKIKLGKGKRCGGRREE